MRCVAFHMDLDPGSANEVPLLTPRRQTRGIRGSRESRTEDPHVCPRNVP
jgi:hypothetical protein